MLMTFKSGFTNENSAVRWERAPGPLREAAGFSYQEFSNLEHPLALKDNPWRVAGADNKVSTWAEFLLPTSAKPLGVLRSSIFRSLAGHHSQPVRLGHAYLRGHRTLRRTPAGRCS